MVIKTILLDMPTNFLLGFLFIWFGRNHVLSTQTFWTKPLIWAWLYSALVFVPITGWYFFAHQGWSTVYLRSEDKIPSWAGPVIVFLYFIGMVLGSSLAQATLRTTSCIYYWALFGAGLVWLVAVTILTGDEYLHIGTYLEYHSGTARTIFADSAFLNQLNFMGAALAVPAIVLFFYLAKTSSHLRTSR